MAIFNSYVSHYQRVKLLLPSIAHIQNAQLSPRALKHLVWGKRSLLPRASPFEIIAATHGGHETSAKNAPFCGCFTLNMYVGILMNFQLQCVGVPNGQNM